MADRDPTVNHPEGNTDTRLVPLDPWERDWIYGAVRDALNNLGLVPQDVQRRLEVSYRLNDLMKKTYPTRHNPAKPKLEEPN